MSTWKIELARIDISEDIFEEILNTWKYIKCDNIFDYVYGYPNRLIHKTDLDEYIIVPTFRYNFIVKKLGYHDAIIEDKNENVQLILRKNIGISKPAPVISGRKAYNMIIKILKKHYTMEEIDSIFKQHTRIVNKDLSQYHYTLPRLEHNVYKYTNVVKYDINKAHASAFIKMFPKAKDDLLKLVEKGNYYKSIGDEANTVYYKNIFNYAVGYLTRQNYRETYNYIVQTTTELLLSTMKKCNGKLIYANTDSFAIQYPENLLNATNELGEFKLECDTDIYFYRDTHYFIYEYTDIKGKKVQVGSCLKTVRDNISLKDGIVASYKVDRSEKFFDQNGREHVRLKPYDIIKEKLDEIIL